MPDIKDIINNEVGPLEEIIKGVPKHVPESISMKDSGERLGEGAQVRYIIVKKYPEWLEEHG